MSSATGYIKGACVACSGHIEFPSEAAGMKIPCPHCGRETALLDNLQPAGVVQLRVGLPPPNSSPDPGPKSNAAPAPLPRQRPPSAPASANSPSPRPQVNVPIPAAKTAAPPATAKPAPTKEPLKASGAAPKAAAAPKPAAKVSIECPSCGLEVSVRAEACPGCGAVLKEKQKFPWMAIAAGVVAIGAVVYFGSNALFKKNKPALVTWITGKFASLTGKKGGTTSPGETKPPEPATADNKPAPPPPPEPKPVV
ncbi:MAG: hypothetical protein HY301_14015, partial [Verrucomicrobia bacterium]|nr:hypothetical protein [Verrucomicrobiota bacterium]